MKFNFEEDNTVVPPAEYLCVVLDAKEKISKSGGNPMLELKLQIQGTDYWGTCIIDRLVFINNKPAKDKLKNFCNAVNLAVEGEVDIDPNNILGKQLLVTIENGEFLGKNQNKVAPNGYKKYENEVPF